MGWGWMVFGNWEARNERLGLVEWMVSGMVD